MSPVDVVALDDRCVGCGLCLVTCPEHALVRARRHPELMVGRCTGCLACVEVCPVDAITPTRLPRFLPSALRARP